MCTPYRRAQSLSQNIVQCFDLNMVTMFYVTLYNVITLYNNITLYTIIVGRVFSVLQSDDSMLNAFEILLIEDDKAHVITRINTVDVAFSMTLLVI